MEGGINAWHGLVATGAPDAGMAYFSDKERAEDIIELAWSLEEGARVFYNGVEELVSDKEHKDLFKELGAAEVRHKAMLDKLRKEFSPDSGSGLSAGELKEVMEGGMRIPEALEWCRGRDIKDIIDLSVALETNSYDLYLKMARKASGTDAEKIFRPLADEEKRHLERLLSLLDQGN